MDLNPHKKKPNHYRLGFLFFNHKEFIYYVMIKTKEPPH